MPAGDYKVMARWLAPSHERLLHRPIRNVAVAEAMTFSAVVTLIRKPLR